MDVGINEAGILEHPQNHADERLTRKIPTGPLTTKATRDTQ